MKSSHFNLVLLSISVRLYSTVTYAAVTVLHSLPNIFAIVILSNISRLRHAFVDLGMQSCLNILTQAYTCPIILLYYNNLLIHIRLLAYAISE